MVILSETFGRGISAVLMSINQSCIEGTGDLLMKRDDIVVI